MNKLEILDEIDDNMRKATLVAELLHSKLATSTPPLSADDMYDCQMLSEIVAEYNGRASDLKSELRKLEEDDE